jgi:signal transduction histidine kinase
MPFIDSLSLKTKSILFLIAYTLILEGGVLAYFYYSSSRAIERQSEADVSRYCSLAIGSIERELSDSEMELTGLRSLLKLAQIPDLAQPFALKPAEELALALPRKYAEIGVLDRKTQHMMAVRTTSEFTGIYSIIEDRPEQELARECLSVFQESTASSCMAGPMPGAHGHVIEIAMPLEVSGDRYLVARIYLDFLLQTLREIPSQANISAFAADESGLMLFATDASLLGTYVQNSSPQLGFRPGEDPTAKGPMRFIPAKTVQWVRLQKPAVLVSIEKDCSSEFRQLQIQVISLASFTGVIAIVALLGIRVLIARMAASLGRVTDVAQVVAGGDFSRRIDIAPRRDEIGLLVSSFNTMTEKLARSYTALNEVNEQLRRKIRDLIRTRRRLSQKQRLALVGEAMSKTSHEIQNKIGGIGIWVQNLERCGFKDEVTSECIRELKSALASSQDMLLHFKQFYRQPPLQVVAIPAAELVDFSLARVASDIQSKGLKIVREGDGKKAQVRIDLSQMCDAVVNLLLNAIHFSPDHGTLTLGVHLNGRRVVFSFSDQGPGLNETDKLFQPFFTTRPMGSGLGLAIAKNIVAAHSGRLRGYNRAEGGACFEIHLPLEPDLPA